MATRQGTKAAAAAADGESDPKFEWMENPTNYVLRLNLLDFRVQVDDAGRLTVRGQRPAGVDGRLVRFQKVFQLPPTANLDEISGRFEANVLTLTVPKRPATTPATMDQEMKKPKEEEQEDTKPPKEDDEAKKTTDTKPPKGDDEAKKTTDTKPPKEDEPKKQDDVKKPRDEPKEEEILKQELDQASKVQQKEEEEAKRRKQEQEQEQEQKPSLAVRKEEVMKPNVEAATAPTEKQAKPEAAGERAKSFDWESLGERMRRRAEEERAKAAAAAEEAEREMTTVCDGWKERVVEELADMKWADGLVEAARKNKEVIAVAVAAFSLGFFVSQKFFSRK